VAKGINGRNTRIVALGDVETRFVQHSSVAARGHIIVTSHLVNAQVCAGGRLVVGGEAGERGSIAGGRAWASAGIEAGQAGSATAEATLWASAPPQRPRRNCASSTRGSNSAGRISCASSAPSA